MNTTLQRKKVFEKDRPKIALHTEGQPKSSIKTIISSQCPKNRNRHLGIQTPPRLNARSRIAAVSVLIPALCNGTLSICF